MPFDPNANQLISLENASVLTANFRQKFPDSITANAYNKKQMLLLLNQTNCEGFRVYNGIDALGVQQLVIVGVDANGDDLFRGILIDQAQPCPTVCSSPNVLNSNT
jgi:hypothetical protein